jgi:hypothetical protein
MYYVTAARRIQCGALRSAALDLIDELRCWTFTGGSTPDACDNPAVVSQDQCKQAKRRRNLEHFELLKMLLITHPDQLM